MAKVTEYQKKQFESLLKHIENEDKKVIEIEARLKELEDFKYSDKYEKTVLDMLAHGYQFVHTKDDLPKYLKTTYDKLEVRTWLYKIGKCAMVYGELSDRPSLYSMKGYSESWSDIMFIDEYYNKYLKK